MRGIICTHQSPAVTDSPGGGSLFVVQNFALSFAKIKVKDNAKEVFANYLSRLELLRVTSFL